MDLAHVKAQAATITRQEQEVDEPDVQSEPETLIEEDEIIKVCEEEEGEVPVEYKDLFNFPHSSQVDVDDIDLHVVVPEGLIIARLRSDPKRILWQKHVRLAT